MTDIDAVRQVHHSLGELAEAWTYLDDDALDAASRRRRHDPRPMGAGAAATLADLIRVEREARVPNARKGYIPLPATPSPAALDVVDAEAFAMSALLELSWLAASMLRGRGFGWPPLQITRDNAAAWLHLAVRHVPDSLAREMADLLADAAAQLRAVLGIDVRDDEVVIDGRMWVTAHRAQARVEGAKPHNVRDWHRRGLVVDEHGRDRSVLSDRRRWYPLADLRRAKAAVTANARGLTA